MIDQYLQVAIEFIKEIWFLLNNMFGLEETQAFKFLKPYLIQAQDKPTYVLIAFFLLVLLPYILYKIKRISNDREKKLDALIEEMEDDEEEIDINDPRRLRRSDQDDKPKPLADENNSKDKENKTDPPHVPILKEFDESEKQDEFHLDTQKIMGQDEGGINLKINNTEDAEEITDEKLDEFEDFEFDVESDKTGNPSTSNYYTIDENLTNDDTETEELTEQNLKENEYNIEDTSNDEADNLINRLKYFQENLDKRLQKEDTKDPFAKSKTNVPRKDRNFFNQGRYLPEFSPADKEKNIEVIESFIFLKDQKRH